MEKIVLRRTMMFVPGNNPGMVRDAYIYRPDCIMFDLEDSVALDQKDAARFLVYEALRTLDYNGIELVVRVNDPRTEGGKLDLEAIVSTRKTVIRLPKTETADDVVYCAQLIEEIERANGIPVGSTRMMAAIESAEGVLNAREIAKASDRLIGIALGAEDYVTDLHTTRSDSGIELYFARSMILLAARAAGIAAIDTVYSDVDNTEGFENEVRTIKQMGFDGKSVINPRQIAPVHAIYTPTEKEIGRALDVMDAIARANSRGSGVISLRGKMIDKPIAERAERTLALARAAGVYEEGEIDG